MHCEIIDRYFNLFFVEILLRKENLQIVFWVPNPVYQSPKRPEYITDHGKGMVRKARFDHESRGAKYHAQHGQKSHALSWKQGH